MSQPTWKMVANLGDASPLDYGGYFVFEDETEVYPPEAELLELVDENDENSAYIVFRFILERCTWQNGILSDNLFNPDHAAWFAQPESKRAERPQDSTYLRDVADYCGIDEQVLRMQFCSPLSIERANAYRCIGEYHGFENLDSYPLTISRQEAESRYPQYA
jgi:hypothetical protein